MFEPPETPVNFEKLGKNSNKFTGIIYTIATLSIFQLLEISSPLLNNFSISNILYSASGLEITHAGAISIITVLTVYTRTENHFQELDKNQNLIANFLVISTLLTALIPAIRQAINQNTILAVSASIFQIGLFYYLTKGGQIQ